MKTQWNDKANASAYRWVLDNAITTKKYTAKELEYTYINDISSKTSSRINRAIELAYYRGQLMGIKTADDMKNTYALSEMEDDGK